MKKSLDGYRLQDEPHASNDTITLPRQTPSQRYFDATSEINTLASSPHHDTGKLSKLHAQQQSLEQAAQDAMEKENIGLALRIAIARVSSDLSMRRETLIANRHDARLSSAFHELFIKNTFHNMANLASMSLNVYENSPDMRRGQSYELIGILHELTALLISYDPDDCLKFSIPSSAHDDQKSTGFHFDIMLYDLNQPKDFRRAIDIKSRKHPSSTAKLSPFARTTFSSETLKNGARHAAIWNNSPYKSHESLQTLRALIDMSNDTATPETEATLGTIRDHFYYTQFEGHRKEIARKMASQTLSSRYITSGTANRT